MKRTSRIVGMILVCVLLTACSGMQKKKQAEQDLADTHIQLGIGYLQQGKKELALTNLNKAINMAPNYASAHNAIAILYAQLGEIELADQHYAKAVSLDSKNSNAQNNYGTFLCDQQRYKKAYTHFEAAVKNPMYQTPDSAYENAGLCAMRNHDYEYAEKSFRKALAIKPILPVSLLNMAELSYRQEEYLKGRAYIQRFEEVGKHNPASLLLALRIEEKLGATDRATNYAYQLKDEFPNAAQTKELVGY